MLRVAQDLRTCSCLAGLNLLPPHAMRPSPPTSVWALSSSKKPEDFAFLCVLLDQLRRLARQLKISVRLDNARALVRQFEHRATAWTPLSGHALLSKVRLPLA